jgi:hypothetical protein
LEIFSDFCVKFFGISGIFRKILRKKEQKFTEKRGAVNLNAGSNACIQIQRASIFWKFLAIFA